MPETWLTYAQAGEHFDMSAEAARLRARRLGWRTRPSNNGRTLGSSMRFRPPQPWRAAKRGCGSAFLPASARSARAMAASAQASAASALASAYPRAPPPSPPVRPPGYGPHVRPGDSPSARARLRSRSTAWPSGRSTARISGEIKPAELTAQLKQASMVQEATEDAAHRPPAASAGDGAARR
jgi:hypothetical protein